LALQLRDPVFQQRSTRTRLPSSQTPVCAHSGETGVTRLIVAHSRTKILVAGRITRDRNPYRRRRKGRVVNGSEPLLSSIERNMVKLVRAGLRNREIAQKLGFTEGTVKVYLNRIYNKTGARNRTELAVRAAEWGMAS